MTIKSVEEIYLIYFRLSGEVQRGTVRKGQHCEGKEETRRVSKLEITNQLLKKNIYQKYLLKA